MKRLFRPAVNTYFICQQVERSGERFLIEVDDVRGVVTAEHLDGYRRLFGMTVGGTLKIAEIQGWRLVRR